MRMAEAEAQSGAESTGTTSVSTPAQRGRIGAHVSWSRTIDRAARTEPGRKGFLARFEREVDPDGVSQKASEYGWPNTRARHTCRNSL